MSHKRRPIVGEPIMYWSECEAFAALKALYNAVSDISCGECYGMKSPPHCGYCDAKEAARAVIADESGGGS